MSPTSFVNRLLLLLLVVVWASLPGCAAKAPPGSGPIRALGEPYSDSSVPEGSSRVVVFTADFVFAEYRVAELLVNGKLQGPVEPFGFHQVDVPPGPTHVALIYPNVVHSTSSLRDEWRAEVVVTLAPGETKFLRAEHKMGIGVRHHFELVADAAVRRESLYPLRRSTVQESTDRFTAPASGHEAVTFRATGNSALNVQRLYVGDQFLGVIGGGHGAFTRYLPVGNHTVTVRFPGTTVTPLPLVLPDGAPGAGGRQVSAPLTLVAGQPAKVTVEDAFGDFTGRMQNLRIASAN